MRSATSEALAKLNLQLFKQINSFPRARTELVDFHYKGAVEDYVAAIKSFAGSKLVVSVIDSVEAARAIRRAVLLSDMVIIRVASHLGSPKLALVPIGDNVRSPVLGASSVLDPVTGKQRVATPTEYMYAMGLMAMARPASSSTIDLLGRPFNSTEEPAWYRTAYSRTSETFRNARREKCHIAGGSVHVQIPEDDRLLEDAKSLLTKGTLAYAPFLSLSVSEYSVAEGALKAELLDAHFGIFGASVTTKAASDLVLSLDFPYLEDAPLELLSKVLDDEAESITAFRREIRRLVEDVDGATGDAEVARRVFKFKRDVLEDELEKVRRALDRVSRMNSVARVGAYVGVGALAVAAFNGLNAASAITGSAGVAAAMLAAAWRNYEDAREARRSPMHLVWQLGRRAPGSV